MAASANDKLMKVGLSTATTLSAPGYTAGGTSINVGATTNWPTDTGVIFAIDTVSIVNGIEVQVAGSYNEFVGTVATGTSITNVDWVDGNGDTNYSAGSTTRVYIPVSKTRENRIVTWGTAQHNQDGTHAAVTATSVVSAGAVTGTTLTGTSLVNTGDSQLRSISLETIASERMFDHVASGCVWTADAVGSTRVASMTAGVVYIGGKRVAVSAVTSRTFTASKDVYVDVDNAGTLTYTDGTTNAASGALAASSIRLAIIVVGATNIATTASINQGQEDRVLPIASSIPYAVTDSLGNLICPRDPNRSILGYRQSVGDFTLSSSQTTPTQVTGLSCPVIVPEGRKVKLTYHTMAVQAAGGGVGQITVWDGVVNAGTRLAQANVPTNNSVGIAEGETTPATTSKTYNAGVHNSLASNITVVGSTVPMFIRVELV